MGKEKENQKNQFDFSLDDLDDIVMDTTKGADDVLDNVNKATDDDKDSDVDKDTDKDDDQTVDDKDEDDEDEKEEEEGEEEEEEDDSTDDSDDSAKEKPDPIKIIAEHLHEKGIVDIPEDFSGKDDEFEALFTKKIEDGINAYKDSLSELSKRFVEFIENGGDPTKFVEVHSQQNFSSLKSEDIEEVDDAETNVSRDSIRKEVIYKALRLQGYDDEKIFAKIKKYDDSGILADEALDSLGIVQKYDKQSKLQFEQEQKKIAKEKQEAFDAWMTNTTKLIDDDLDKIVEVDIPKRKKEEFKDFLLKVNPKTKKTALMEQRESDPNFDIKMAFAAFGGFKLVKDGAKKKANSKLADKLANSSSRSLSHKKTGDKNNMSVWAQLVED